MTIRKKLKIKSFLYWKGLYRFSIFLFNFCLFYFLINNFEIESQIFFIISSSSCSTLIHYIFDKEFSHLRINSKDFLKNLISYSLLSSLLNALFSILNIYIFAKDNQSIYFFKSLILLLAFILLTNSFSKFLFLSIYKFFSKTFLFIGNENEYDSFYKIVNKSYKAYCIDFEDFKDISKSKLNIIISNNIKKLGDELNQSRVYNLNNLKNYSVTDWIEKYLKKFPSDFSSDNFTNNFMIENSNSLNFKIKRFFDVLISIFLILLTSPIFIISILLIYFEDGSPIFYSQIRTGFRGKNIKIWKLRTMHIKAEKYGAQWTSASDPRVTKVGFYLRKFRIDELPQILNVLKKEMSLIGPRPERPEFDRDLEKKIPHYYLRYNVFPGLSGWAQVNYPYAASIEEVSNKLSYDLYYLKNFSIFLDFLIFLKTIKLVLNAKGSVPSNKT